MARRTLKETEFRSDAVRVEDPAILYRLLKLAGDPNSEGLFEDSIESVLVSGNLNRLRELADIMKEEGRWDEFITRARGRIPGSALEEISDYVNSRRGRRARLAAR
jgi:hypothetical protein